MGSAHVSFGPFLFSFSFSFLYLGDVFNKIITLLSLVVVSFLYFEGVFNKTIIPLAIFGYEMG